jgi:hypothetical protein
MHHEYTLALEYSCERHFVRTVEELEGLVIQRLFALSKANLAGTGLVISFIVRITLTHY